MQVAPCNAKTAHSRLKNGAMTARSKLLDYSKPSDETNRQPKQPLGSQNRLKAIEKTGYHATLCHFKKKPSFFFEFEPPTIQRRPGHYAMPDNRENNPPTSKQSPYIFLYPPSSHPQAQPTTMPQSQRTLSTTPTMHTHTASTSGPIWAELASLTLQAFSPELINRLQSFIAKTPSFDHSTHIPLLATLVMRHITLSLKESSLPPTRSFRDVAYHAVMSNKILTKRERSIVRAVSVGRVPQKSEKHVDQLPVESLQENRENQVFPRAGRKDCLQSASMRRLLVANQAPLDIDLLKKALKTGQEREPDNPGRERERQRASIRYATRSVEVREVKTRPRRTCEDTSVANEGDTDGVRVTAEKDNTLREPRVRRERPSRLVQLRKQRLERRKATIT